MRRQRLDQLQPALAVDEGHDLDSARHQRHAIDRPVAALIGDGVIDVEGTEGKLGLEDAGFDQRIRTRHFARESAQGIGIEAMRDHDLGIQQAAKGWRDRQLLGVDCRQTDSRIGVRMTNHRHGKPPMN